MPAWLLAIMNLIAGLLGLSNKKAEEKRLEELEKDDAIKKAVTKATDEKDPTDLNDMFNS